MATAKTESTAALAKALHATKVVEHFMEQTMGSTSYVSSVTKFEMYNKNSDTLTILVGLEVDDVEGFLKQYAPHFTK